jgi:hypothetical protein
MPPFRCGQGAFKRRAWNRRSLQASVILKDQFPGKRTMPAKSKAQKKAAGAALAAKRGDMPKSKLKGASKEMEKSMSESELEDFAETKRKKLPEKKSDKK